MRYLELKIDVSQKIPWNDIFISDLSEIGFESFMEDEKGCLLAYVSENEYKETNLKTVLSMREKQVSFNHSIRLIEEENWNADWESQFEAVYVDEKLEIIAPFHQPKLNCTHTIFIEPKMTFGTGHHQTTYLICQNLLKFPPINKAVLDMGTGTGVLAILAEKLGAHFIDAVEIEDWSIENAIDNASRNECSKIKFFKGSKEQIPNKKYDLIIANINRNVLEDHLLSYFNHTMIGGSLLISGFFTTDNNQLIKLASRIGFTFKHDYFKDEWSLLEFMKL